MKTAKLLHQTVLIACALVFGTTARAQGTFVNLNFESANVPDVPFGQGGGYVATSNGLPGWFAYIGGTATDTIAHNEMSIGAAQVAIFGPNFGPSLILAGKYTASLQPSSGGPPTSAAIGQIGQVPTDAQSLRFYGTGSYVVTFGGQQVPISVIGTTSRYTIFGADFSAFDNQTAELRFQGYGLLDNIMFSNQPIPEPSAAALIFCGAAVLSIRFRRKQ